MEDLNFYLRASGFMPGRGHGGWRAAWLGLVVGLCSCAVGPDYQRPLVVIPPDWEWKTAEPKDHVPKDQWWAVFNDPALSALEAEAMGANQELKAALARVEQARAGARISRADFYPSATGGVKWGRWRTSGNSPSPVPFPVPSFTQDAWSIPFDLSYEVDVWGKVRRSFESARNRALEAEALRQSVLLTLQADVAANYFSLQSAEAEIELLSKTIEIRAGALEVFEQRFRAGLGGEFEVERARVEVETARAGLSAAEQRRAELRDALAVLCGQPPSLFRVEVSPGPAVPPQIAPDLPSALLERRPDVAAAERQLAARNAEIGVAKAAFFPSIRLTGQAGFLSEDVVDLLAWDSRVWTLAPSLVMPLFEGGRNLANYERAKAAYEEAVAGYRQQILVAFQEVEDTLAALHFLRERERAWTEAARAARSAARLSFDRYQAGAVNFLEVVDSEQERLQNEVARVRAGNEQMLATVRLVKVLGGGWE